MPHSLDQWPPDVPVDTHPLVHSLIIDPAADPELAWIVDLITVALKHPRSILLMLTLVRSCS